MKSFSALEQLQAKQIAHLEAENQRLRDALERCAVAAIATDDAQTIARAALDGTP